MSTIDETLKQRQGVHGDFTDNGRVTDEFMAVMYDTPNWNNLAPHQRIALFMIAHKMARVLCGDPNFADHWHDIGGYAKCAEERIVAPESAMEKFIADATEAAQESPLVEPESERKPPIVCKTCGFSNINTLTCLNCFATLT